MAFYVALKLPFIIFLTLFINGMLNGMLSLALGSGIGFRKSLQFLLTGFAIMSIILGALSPISFFATLNMPEPGALGDATWHIAPPTSATYSPVIGSHTAQGPALLGNQSASLEVNLTVAEAPPNIRGNTSAGGNKVVVLETGLKVTTPLFINAGDTVRVNTETGNYSERV